MAHFWRRFGTELEFSCGEIMAQNWKSFGEGVLEGYWGGNGAIKAVIVMWQRNGTIVAVIIWRNYDVVMEVLWRRFAGRILARKWSY